MPDSPIVVLGIQDSRTREWIQSIIVDAGFPVIVKERPDDLCDLTPEGAYHFVIVETGLDGAALDAIYTQLKQQFQGHWNEITVMGILQRPIKDDAWWFKWFADEEFCAVTNIASRDWNEWRRLPIWLRAITEAQRPP